MSKRRFVVIIAVSDYKDSSVPSLPGVRDDARRLWWTLTNYADGGVYRFAWLKDDKATKEDILSTLAAIARTARDTDQIVVYFGGHGAKPHDFHGHAKYRLLPYDASFADASRRGIAPEEVRDALHPVRAAEIVFLFDCCHSGGVSGGPFWNAPYLQKLRDGDNSLYVMAAARGSEEAGETAAGGFFMGALCDALQGKGVTPNHKGQISAAAAWARAEWVTTAEAASHGHIQHPVHAGIGSSIYLTRRVHPRLSPLLCHPYPATKSFTGRTAERELLTDWFEDLNSPPVFVLKAMGGMGKSALAWKWLNDDLLNAGLKPDGLFWWSFYRADATFDNFVERGLSYFGGTGYDYKSSPDPPWRQLVTLVRERRCLLVLDGIERLLWTPEREAVLREGEETSPAPTRQFSECVSLDTQDFLLHLLSHTQAKVLLSTRTTPKELHEREGARLHELKPMSEEDAVAYFRARGITAEKATVPEITSICARYGYHPLALTLLIGTVLKDPKLMGDIRAADRVNPKLTPEEPGRSHDILELAYDALSNELRHIVSQLAAIRYSFAYNTIEAVFAETAAEFPEAIVELEQRGFLTRSVERKEFGIHPVVKQYCYERLAKKMETHAHFAEKLGRLVDPAVVDEIPSVEELLPLLEFYWHTAKSGQYDAAWSILRTCIEHLFYRFGAYQTCIELLAPLFPDSEENPPRLTYGLDRAGVLNLLACCYSALGQPKRAVILSETALGALGTHWEEETLVSELYLGRVISGDEDVPFYYELLVTLLTNIGDQRMLVGDLRQAYRDLWVANEICWDDHRRHLQVIPAQSLQNLWALQIGSEKEPPELEPTIRRLQEDGNAVCESLAWACRAQIAIWRGRGAIHSARKANRLALKADMDYPVVHSLYLLGAAYRAAGRIPEAEEQLVKALIRCRRVKLLELEAPILLERARLLHFRGESEMAMAAADESLGIADRCGYRLQRADIHNVLSQFWLDRVASAATSRAKEDALSRAREHVDMAMELADCGYVPALKEADRLLRKVESWTRKMGGGHGKRR